MADGRHVGIYWKYHNSPTNGPIWMEIGRSHHIVFPTVHWTFSFMGVWRLNTWTILKKNSVNSSKLGPQWQSRDQILKCLKFKMADGRHVGKYWKCHNSPPNGPIWTKLGWSHPIKLPTCPPGNGALDIQQLSVTGIWRPNAWTTFDEIWYTTANLDHNNSHVIEY